MSWTSYLISVPKRARNRFKRVLRWVYARVAAFPLLRRIEKKNVFATAFYGMKYGDNPAYIIEELHKLRPELKIFWEWNPATDFQVPSFVTKVKTFSWSYFRHLMSDGIMINSHDWSPYYKKDHRQFLLNTWHGGLGIKKIAGDNKRMKASPIDSFDIVSKLGPSDLVLSNSAHLTRIIRRAFNYRGPIWESGYPKTDLLFGDREKAREYVRKSLNITNADKLIIYLPTIRIYLHEPIFKNNNPYPYNLDFDHLKECMEKRFGGNWHVLVRKHPCMNDKYQREYLVESIGNGHYIDVTNFPDIQQLIMACDACISDFSSAIFDAALLEMPCFTYANDETYYEKDIGTYYKLGELPFPYATGNEELTNVIDSFNETEYVKKWRCFRDKIAQLRENGHATRDIAHFLCDVCDGKNTRIKDCANELLIKQKEDDDMDLT